MERKILKPNQYPAGLREIPKVPEEMYLIGEMPDSASGEPSSAEYIYLAVVGTRKFSGYGKEACEKIIGGLAGYPFAIVSGLALGIDAIAHRAALDAGLKTIAIPGSGLDFSVLHPRTNHRLAKEIIESGGALLSEFDWEEPAGLHTFPQRNRIIAGISRATLVVEAPERSGALITANFALDFNRDVFAVPGSKIPRERINSLSRGRFPFARRTTFLTLSASRATVKILNWISIRPIFPRLKTK